MIQQSLQLLSEHPDVAFATCEDGKPRLRQFQIMKIDGTTLYFATSARKAVYRQLKANPAIELLAASGKRSVRCSGTACFEVADEVKQWIFQHNEVLHRLYDRYDAMEYFSMEIETLDYYDLEPTPPVMECYNLKEGTPVSGFVGTRWAKTDA